MTRRGRLLAVVAILAAGAIGIISSTQTWLFAALTTAEDPLPVPGASAIPVLAPLSLAVLALGAALSIVGPVFRHVFGALTVLAAAALLWLTAPVAFAPSVPAVASAVTKATGIAGADGVAALVESLSATAWPAVTFAGWIVLLAAGVFTLATAHAWKRSGRRYAAEAAHVERQDAGPLDAVDTWDDLSRGDDPTR